MVFVVCACRRGQRGGSTAVVVWSTPSFIIAPLAGHGTLDPDDGADVTVSAHPLSAFPGDALHAVLGLLRAVATSEGFARQRAGLVSSCWEVCRLPVTVSFDHVGSVGRTEAALGGLTARASISNGTSVAANRSIQNRVAEGVASKKPRSCRLH